MVFVTTPAAQAAVVYGRVCVGVVIVVDAVDVRLLLLMLLSLVLLRKLLIFFLVFCFDAVIAVVISPRKTLSLLFCLLYAIAAAVAALQVNFGC